MGKIPPQPVDGYLDAASLSQVTQFFDLGPNEDRVYPWSWQSVIEVTALLIATEHMHVIPGFWYPNHRLGPVMDLAKEAVVRTGLLQNKKFSDETYRYAIQQAKRWATTHAPEFRAICMQVTEDSANGQRWIDWYRTKVWSEYAQRFEGVFHPAIAPQLAIGFGLSQSDVQDIRKVSRDERRIGSDAFLNSPDYPLVRDCFVIDVLIRGMAYDYLARRERIQAMHHPARLLATERPTTQSPAEFASNAEYFLATIIVAAAFAESTLECRVGLWAENIKKVKLAKLIVPMDLEEKASRELALKAALEAVRKAGLRISSNRLDQILDWTIVGSIGVLTSFVVGPFVGLASTFGMKALTDKLKGMNWGQAAARMIGHRERHLRELAEAVPGRLLRRWGGLW